MLCKQKLKKGEKEKKWRKDLGISSWNFTFFPSLFQTLKVDKKKHPKKSSHTVADDAKCLCLIPVFSLLDFCRRLHSEAGDEEGQRYTSLKQINLPLDLKGMPTRGINIYNCVCLSDLGFVFLLSNRGHGREYRLPASPLSLVGLPVVCWVLGIVRVRNCDWEFFFSELYCIPK